MVCEQFFEKIKDSPSVIRLNQLIKVSKMMYYRQMLGRKGVGESEEFVKMVLSLF